MVRIVQQIQLPTLQCSVSIGLLKYDAPADSPSA